MICINVKIAKFARTVTAHPVASGVPAAALEASPHELSAGPNRALPRGPEAGCDAAARRRSGAGRNRRAEQDSGVLEAETGLRGT